MKFKKFMKMAAERHQESLQDVARAIREQTDYFREDDKKDVDTEAVEDTMKRPSFTEPRTFTTYDEAQSSHASSTAMDFDAQAIYRSSVNVIRRAQGMEEVDPETPVFIVQLMRETPHQFTAKQRLRMTYGQRIGRLSRQECRLCDLTFRNPVHLIQMASLSED